VTSAAARAEAQKLAHVLGVEPQELAFLERAGAADVRAVRDDATERLFALGHDGLTRAAAASRLLPASILATIAQRGLGPLLCARIAGELDPARAAEVAAHLPEAFLAEVATHVDPRRVSGVAAGIPAVDVAAIARRLADAGQWVPMGRFVTHLDDDALRASMGALADEEVLRVAFVLEDHARMTDLVDALGRRRLDRIVRAAREHGLEDEAREVLRHVPAALREELDGLGEPAA
jgi:hypothetical protein